MKFKFIVILGSIIVICTLILSSINIYAYIRGEETEFKNIECKLLLGSGIKKESDIVQPLKDICIGERAWNENNSNLCKDHTDKAHCYSWMAIKTGNLELCQNNQGQLSYFVESKLTDSAKQKDYLYDCYRAVANWRNAPEICEQIPYKDSDRLDECKRSALINGNFEELDSSPI